VTSPTRTSISALPRGHEFAAASFALSREQVGAYLRATGDRADYGKAIPPLALVALGLNALQEHLSLPEGSLHTGQEVEHERTVRAGDALTLSGRVAQRSERQGFVISVIEFEVASSEGVAVRARTTIMAPGGAS
jgi:MaoC dehydratase-like protein